MEIQTSESRPSQLVDKPNSSSYQCAGMWFKDKQHANSIGRQQTDALGPCHVSSEVRYSRKEQINNIDILG